MACTRLSIERTVVRFWAEREMIGKQLVSEEIDKSECIIEIGGSIDIHALKKL